MKTLSILGILSVFLLWASGIQAEEPYKKPNIKFSSKFMNEPVKVYEEDWDKEGHYKVQEQPASERNVASDPDEEKKKWERHPSSQSPKPAWDHPEDRPMYWKWNKDLVD